MGIFVSKRRWPFVLPFVSLGDRTILHDARKEILLLEITLQNTGGGDRAGWEKKNFPARARLFGFVFISGIAWEQKPCDSTNEQRGLGQGSVPGRLVR